MKYVRILCAVALVFALCSAFTMKDKEKAVYAFGVAASFNDSIVYYTDIQVLDSVELDKNGFLPKRDFIHLPAQELSGVQSEEAGLYLYDLFL